MNYTIKRTPLGGVNFSARPTEMKGDQDITGGSPLQNMSAYQVDGNRHAPAHIISGVIWVSRSGTVSATWDDGLVKKLWFANKKSSLMNRIPLKSDGSFAVSTYFPYPMLSFTNEALANPICHFPETWTYAVAIADNRQFPDSPDPRYAEALMDAEEHICKVASQCAKEGSSENLRRLAAVLDDASEYAGEARRPANTNNILVESVVVATRKVNRVPTQDEVWLEVPPRTITTRKGFEKVIRRIGFNWLPRNERELEGWRIAYRAQPLRAAGWNDV